MSGLGTVLRQRFIVKGLCFVRIEREIKLIFPAKFEAGFADGVVAFLGRGMPFPEVGGVGGDLVGDDAFADVVAVGEAEVLFGCDVAEHGTAVPSDHGGADAAGDVIVAGGNIGGEGAEGVEGGFMAPVELVVHVLLDHVHGYVAGTFAHDLDAAIPGAFGEFALGFEFGELWVVVGVRDGSGAEAVADGEADIVGGHEIADIVPVFVEKAFAVM